MNVETVVWSNVAFSYILFLLNEENISAEGSTSMSVRAGAGGSTGMSVRVCTQFIFQLMQCLSQSCIVIHTFRMELVRSSIC